ncbi:MAG: NADH-quinone oxidoreductase subunit C, partial [Bacteroidota bacterium]
MSVTVDYKKVVERIGEKFGAKVHSPEEPFGMLTLRTDKDSIIPLLQFLRDDEEMQFIFLTD